MPGTSCITTTPGPRPRRNTVSVLPSCVNSKLSKPSSGMGRRYLRPPGPAATALHLQRGRARARLKDVGVEPAGARHVARAEAPRGGEVPLARGDTDAFSLLLAWLHLRSGLGVRGARPPLAGVGPRVGAPRPPLRAPRRRRRRLLRRWPRRPTAAPLPRVAARALGRADRVARAHPRAAQARAGAGGARSAARGVRARRRLRGRVRARAGGGRRRAARH